MNSSYKLRISIIFLLFTSLYLIIIGNLFFIQIINQSFYAQLAHQQYNVTVTTKADRSQIFDRNGIALAMNHEYVSAFLMPRKINNPELVEPFLKKHWPQALKRLYAHRQSPFMFLERNITPEQQAMLAERKLSDIKLMKESGRFYPHPYTAQIIGMTNIDNEGVLGIEQQFEHQLAGVPTTYQLEKDARSGYFYLNREMKVEGTAGTPVTLTIDNTLQFLAGEELKEAVTNLQAESGSVLIMNGATGEILTMVSYPLFDPNKAKELDIEATKNNIISDAHELGSVIKVFTALAALEENVVTADEPIDCQMSKETRVMGRIVTTWTPHGVIPFREVIQKSNNVGVAKVATRLGENLYRHLTKLGFGSKTGIELPGEQAGFVNPPSKWSKQSIISLSFGYEIMGTILQLARAFSVFCNDGKLVQPTIILPPHDQKPKLSDQLYNPETITTMREILEETVSIGTGHHAQLKGYTVMGKTGSANLAVDGKYDKTKSIYTFSGIVERDGYKRIIIAFIKKPLRYDLFASTIAAPLFAKVAERMVIHERIL